MRQDTLLDVVLIASVTTVLSCVVISIVVASSGILTKEGRPFEHNWWKKGVIYQIYARSFFDSNNDGVGDVKGIRAKLSYLSWLGVKTLWLLPHFESPLRNSGYDTTGIWHLLDGHDDVIRLVDAVKDEGMYIILSLPMSYTSDQHYWFIESRKETENEHSDFYVWSRTITPTATNATRNRLIWAKNEDGRQEFYLALGDPRFPLLNFKNDEVKSTMARVLHAWLDTGLDGIVFEQVIGYEGQLEGASFVAPSSLAMAGSWCTNVKYYNAQHNRKVISVINPVDQGSVNSAQFADLSCTAIVSPALFSLRSGFPSNKLITGVTNWLALLPSTSVIWTSGSGLQERVASRLSSDFHSQAILLLVVWLPGVPAMMYGSELGLKNIQGVPLEYAEFHAYSRQYNLHQFAPMPWSDQQNAGFSKADPSRLWLPVLASTYRSNVAKQMIDSNSILHFTRRLLSLWAKMRLSDFDLGSSIRFLSTYSEEMVAFVRFIRTERYVVLINIGTLGGKAVFDLTTQLDSTTSTVYFSCGPEADIFYPQGKVVLLNRLALTNGQGVVLTALS